MNIKIISLMFLIISILVHIVSCSVTEQNEKELKSFSIQGTLAGWIGEENKTIVLGKVDEVSDEIIVFGSAQISNDGGFNIETLSPPPINMLEQVIEYSQSILTCGGNFDISNSNILLGRGDLFVLENDTVFGKVITGEIELENKFPPAGHSYVEYIYSQGEVTLKGVRNCAQNNGKVANITADISLSPGWNSIVIRTLSESDSEVNVIYTSEQISLLNCTFYPGEIIDVIEGEYDFNVEGQIDSWDLGSDKILQFGVFIKFTDQFEVLAESQISEDGKFKFEKAKNPSIEILRGINQGLEFHGFSSVGYRLDAEDTTATGYDGIFTIVDKNSQRLNGYVVYENLISKDWYFDVGSFSLIFYFTAKM